MFNLKFRIYRMANFGINNVAQQIDDENAQQAFKENETFLKTLYDTTSTTDANLSSFKESLILKIRSDLDGVDNTSTSAEIGSTLQALNKSLKELL